MKIVILGDSGVGKTTLLQQYVHQKAATNTKPTITASVPGGKDRWGNPLSYRHALALAGARKRKTKHHCCGCHGVSISAGAEAAV